MAASLETATYLDHLRTDIDRILLTPTESLDARVAACPGWSVGDLVGHTSGVFAFATAQLRAEPGSDLVSFDPPPDGAPLSVFADGAAALLAALDDTDPTEHRPNWARHDTAAFWFRRMAQEAAMHRWDVQAAASDGPEPIETTLAIDGIDELADVFLIAAKRRGIIGDGETVHLHATDDGIADGDDGVGEWMFTFGADRVDVTHEHGKGDMAVRGRASDLLLFVWNRRPIDVQTFGDTDALTWWAERVTI